MSLLTTRRALFCLLILGGIVTLYAPATPLPAEAAQATIPSTVRPTVYIPYFTGETYTSAMGIFWFGRVNDRENYADVRISYDDRELYVRVAIFDRYVWYDPKPNLDKLDHWDAVSLYLSPDPAAGDAHFSPKRFVAQVSDWQDDANYQAAWSQEDGAWMRMPIPFTTKTGWRGGGPNNNAKNERGWTLAYRLPFSSFGLDGPPPAGTVWRIAAVVHDRDDQAGTPIPDQVWPQDLNRDQPQTWGRLHFGLLPAYTPPAVENRQTFTIRHGLNGTVVPDAEVGGTTTCGHGVDFWRDWGNLNYAGREHFNIQNQIDVVDWPCFAKYYVTFPLDTLPPDKVVISATLTLHQFGNSGQGWEPGPIGSTIQVFAVEDAWDESTLTWNNAPLANANVARTWVEPVATTPPWPGIPHTWDLSQTVAEIHATGGPLRLALYSADGAYHSGKYFVSSDTGDWNAGARPTLRVTLGDPIEATSPNPPPTHNHSLYLPALVR
ncbi:MAG: DNRLRE domain-containing protein [Caldilineaceae bacterium]|nr:DNRLRE domain-containing protein [Caldilineaceae bacterium]